MNINRFFLKPSFFLVLFFLAHKVSAESRKDIVFKTTETIKQHLFPVFYEKLIKDISSVYALAKTLSYDSAAQEAISIQEKIAALKESKFIFDLFKKMQLISKEKQIKIVAFMLYSLFAVFSNEKNREEVLRNENMQGVLMLLAMSGISIKAFDSIKQIVSVIAKDCQSLKNDVLDDLTYEETVYAILENVALLLVEKNIFSAFAEEVFLLEKEALMKDMHTSKQKTAKRK
jgi:hypothetical protein